MTPPKDVVISVGGDVRRVLVKIQSANAATPTEVVSAMSSALLGYIDDHARNLEIRNAYIREVAKKLVQAVDDPSTPRIDIAKETAQ